MSRDQGLDVGTAEGVGHQALSRTTVNRIPGWLHRIRFRPVDWIECNPHRLMYIASRADGATFEMPSAERAELWLDSKPTRALSPDNS